MTEMELDPAVAERMGYPNLVAASEFSLDGLTIELGLLAPNPESGEHQWCVVIHSDCDPDEPSRGSSGMEPCGTDRDEAEAYYLSRLAEVAGTYQNETRSAV